MTWHTVRTLTDHVGGETSRPAVADFVGIGPSGGTKRYVELAFDLVFADPFATAHFSVWRRSDGRIDKLTTSNITIVDGIAAEVKILDLFGEAISVRVEQVSSPISGTVRAREVAL